MSFAAIFLVLISAVVHAGWNLIGQRGRPGSAVFLVANTLGCLILLPALPFALPALGSISPAVWGLLVATGLFQALYYVAMAGAYRLGDLSLAYPIARAAPVVIVVVINFLLGRGDQLSGVYLGGAALVLMGILITPQQQFGSFRPRDYLNRVCVFCLAAAVCTAGYSLIDDRALRLLRSAPGLPVSGLAATLLFALVEGLLASLWLGLVVLASAEERKDLKAILCDSRAMKMYGVMGCGIFLSYTLVLVAMGFASNVSYIVTFRQMSIPLGAILGMTVQKEPRYLPRIVGVTVIFAGLILVGLG